MTLLNDTISIEGNNISMKIIYIGGSEDMDDSGVLRREVKAALSIAW